MDRHEGALGKASTRLKLRLCSRILQAHGSLPATLLSAEIDAPVFISKEAFENDFCFG